jgi:hypothetical protein
VAAIVPAIFLDLVAWWSLCPPRVAFSPEQMSDTLPLDLDSNPLGDGRHVSSIADPFNGPSTSSASRTSSAATAGSRPPGTT